MYRVSQYSRGFRYSGYGRKRNWFTDRYRKGRFWKSSGKTSSWRTGAQWRRRPSKPKCLNEILPVAVSTGVRFLQAGYVTMPEYGISSACRKKKFILLKGAEMQGTIRVMSLPVDSKEVVSMDVERVDPPQLDGMVTILVVLDKQPRGDDLTKFEEIFDCKEGGYRGDATLKNAALDRYSLVIKKRQVFQSKDSPSIISFRAPYAPKERIWVKFHDYDDGTRGGNFKNIAANALLYYVVYESHGNCVWSPNVSSCITFE